MLPNYVGEKDRDSLFAVKEPCHHSEKGHKLITKKILPLVIQLARAK